MKPFTSKHCTQYLTKKSPLYQTKIETEGKTGPDGKPQGSTEYVNKSGNRSVEVAKDFLGNERKTVRRQKKDGTIKTKSRVISEERAERIKKRKNKNL